MSSRRPTETDIARFENGTLSEIECGLGSSIEITATGGGGAGGIITPGGAGGVSGGGGTVEATCVPDQ